MLRRLIHCHTVERTAEHVRDFLAADDFILHLEAVFAAGMLPPGALAYCLDLVRERALFSCHTRQDLQRILAAPFMYTEQFLRTRSITSVPLESLAESLPPAEAMQPTLVFSPGRTGSTLLVRMLTASGVAAVSEPDMLAQMAQLPGERAKTLPPGTREALCHACVALLTRELGPRPVIKLRSHCNERPLVLVEALPGCRAVFMLRGVAEWALSRHRVFQESPMDVAFTLRHAVDALDKLRASCADFVVVWFEDLLAHPRETLRAVAPHANPDPAGIAAALRADSQEGTIIARSEVAGRPTDENFLPAFPAAWREARAGAEWSAPTQALLAEMWRR
jgi:hypothetical protein